MLMVGDLLSEPFLPHRVVCGLFNHYIRGARHISYGVSGPVASGGGVRPFMVPSTSSVLLPSRLDSASTYNLLVIPGGSTSPSPSSLSPSTSLWW